MSRLGTIATVVRAGLRANFGLAVLKYRLLVEKKDRWLLPLVAVAGLSVVPFFYGIVLLVRNVYAALAPMGQQRALLSFGFLAAQALILLFGLYYVIAAFYFSRDLEFLIPLPLRPSEVMASKFAVIVVNEYLTVAAVVLPVVVTYGVVARGGPGYWANAVLVYLALPVIPLAVVSFLVVAMMRFVNLSRKKDALILIGSILLLVGALAVQIELGRSAAAGGGAGGAGGLGRGQGLGGNTAAIAAFLTSPNSLLGRVGAFFPPGIWATKAVAGGFTGEGLANLGLLWGVSALLFAAIVVLAEKLFYRGLVGLGETTGKRRRLTRVELARRVSSGRRAKAAIFAREWKIMNRTPIFLLNGTFVVILIPAIFVLMATVGRGAGGGVGGAGGAGTGASVDPIIKAIASEHPLIAILATALFMTVCGSLNGTASSTFSREGSQFWISKVIPVAPREQAAAKFWHSYLVAALGVVTAGIAAAAVLHVGAAELAAAAGLALLAGVLMTAVGMAIDLARPLLDWANPQKAIKQNLNVLLAMLAEIGILTGLYFGVTALTRAGIGEGGVLAILFMGLGALSAAAYGALLRFADKRYPEIV